MENVRIRKVSIYYPDNIITNDYYIDHFKKQGKDIESFLKIMGRKERYIIDSKDETTLTMGIEAAKRVLEESNFSSKDIDLIAFSTQVPETIFPTNALQLHDAIQASPHAIVYDSNANCAGMTVTIEQVCHYMRSNQRILRALIVGSDHYSLLSDPNTEITYACVGDAAAAVILEKTEDETGFIDSEYYTYTAPMKNILYPPEGFRNGIRTGNIKHIQWLPFDGAESLPTTYKMITELLERNQVKPSQVKYCFSQFAWVNVQRIQEHFELADHQIIFVGDKYGYTGTSSPFIALYEGVKSGQIQEGDYVLFWTIGTGYQLVATLFKY